MANRIPLVFDTVANKIKELPSGDNLNMSSSSINDAININASGAVAANTVNTVNLNIAGTPIGEVAKTNSYTDLSNLPTLFDGNYNSLTNKPSAIVAAWADITGKPVIASNLSQLINDTNFVTNAQVTISSSQVSGLAAVATGGSWTDLTDSAQLISRAEIAGGTLTIDVNNTGDLEGSVFSTDGGTKLIDGVTKSGALVNLDITGDITGNIIGDHTGTHIGDVYSSDGIKQVLFSGNTFEEDALFRGNVSGQLFAPDNSSVLVSNDGIHYGDFRGNVVGDDSSIMVDAVTNSVNAGTIVATTKFIGNVESTSTLTLTALSGITLSPAGPINIPNATTISLSATSTIGIGATNDLTLTSSSGNVVVQDHISITNLKTLVAGAADYAAFQSAIAAL